MKNNIIKRLIIISLALAVVLSGTTVNANIVLSKKETTKYINTIAHRLMSEVKNPSHSSVGGEWTVMGLARAGKITSNYKNIYKRNLKKALDGSNGELSKRNYTDYSRTVIALTSIGENPYNFYGYDVVDPLAEADNVIKQGTNGVAYALIALSSGNYDVVPKSGYEGKAGNREKYKEVLVSMALSNGGWTIFGKKADIDMTAIAIQALAPYYKEDKVKNVINKGLKLISDRQKSTGGFESMGNENCESSAQVLTAISSLGISVKDKRFVKSKHTVLDGLMKFYENGAFKHIEEGMINQMSTDQAFYALVAYRNNLANDPPLFNMKKVAVKKKYRKAAKPKKKVKTKNQSKKNYNNNKIEETTANNKTKEKKKTKVKKENKPIPTTAQVEVKKPEKKAKQKDKEKTAPWFWIGFGIIVAGGAGFIIYKKVGRKNV